MWGGEGIHPGKVQERYYLQEQYFTNCARNGLLVKVMA